MRSLGTEKTLEEKRKQRGLWLSVIMLVILMVGTAGFAFLSGGGNDDEDNFGAQDGERWIMDAGGISLSFKYSPESIAYVPVDIETLFEDYAGKPLYLVADEREVLTEIGSTLGQYTNRVQEACYGECEDDLPEKSCNETDERIIIFEKNVDDKIYELENCVFIEGNISTVDAFLYRVFGVTY